MLSNLPTDKLRLQEQIEQQRTTIAALKRDCHETTDAERHLRYLASEQAAAPDRRTARQLRMRRRKEQTAARQLSNRL